MNHSALVYSLFWRHSMFNMVLLPYRPCDCYENDLKCLSNTFFCQQVSRDIEILGNLECRPTPLKSQKT